jgi:hypothetical protein
MHKKNDGPPTTFPPFNLQRIEERFAMSKDTTLVGRAFEEFRDGGIVAIRHDAGVRKVLGEQNPRPENRRVLRAAYLSRGLGLLFLAKERRQAAFGFRGLFFLAMRPCLFWMALKAVDENDAVKDESAAKYPDTPLIGQTCSATGFTPSESTVNPSSRTLNVAI